MFLLTFALGFAVGALVNWDWVVKNTTSKKG
jgi:hypothetical protein